MKNLSIFILVLSSIAVFLRATFKLEGNPNSTWLLGTGLLAFIAGVLLFVKESKAQ